MIGKPVLSIGEFGFEPQWIETLPRETMTKVSKESNDRIRDERDRLRAIFENLMDGVFITDRDFRVEFMNQDLRYQFGDGLGRKCHEFFGLSPTNCLQCHEGMSAFGPPHRLEWTSLLTRCTYDMLVSPLSNPDGTTSRLHILRDVTEQKKLESQLLIYSQNLETKVAKQADRLRRQERLALLGEIASGLAHEIRTPLGALLTGIKLLEKSDQQESDKEMVLSLLKKETLRLKHILSEFLAYARPGKPNMISGVLSNVLKETVAQLQQDSELSGDVQITYESASDETTCDFDRAKMKEVFLNLAVNGLQALDGEGTLRLISFQSQGQQWVQIIDNGPGIDAEDLEQIFKPFFTRKQEGTGLGLAIAQGIVEDHGGRIRVNSSPGRETTFTVSWPITARSEESA
ncbi:MAG: PAS domain-containing protein [Deltaproteobacteria bacterium]|nr:MAG: PAS domain-containing protein [Deltaproteobacteria bacterium]